MTSEELKIRQLTNQHILSPADKLTVVRDLCGVQAQFMPNAMHSLQLRTNDFDLQTLADGLVKNWSVRGTVHVFAESDLPLFIRCNNGASYRKNDWSGYTFWNQRREWALTPERQRYFAALIVEAVSTRVYTRDELKQLCRDRGMTELEEAGMFDAWGGGIRELCERGFMHYVVQEKKAYIASPAFTPMPEEAAKTEIARRYFTHMGPATIQDAMYFTGAKQAEVKNWLKQLPVEAAECNGKTYYYIPSGNTYDQDIPSCVFLAGFDQLMLGYQKKESLYLPEENLRKIFNLAGIVMPSVLLNGRVVGKWKKQKQRLAITLFESLNTCDRQSIERAAEELWHGTVQVAFCDD